jgi:hypothetical protein
MVPDYRPFPVHALPVVLREFAAEAAAAVGADVAFAALPALTVAGAAVGATVVVSPKRKFREPPALWCCTVGDSGTGKSPCWKPAADLVLGIDARLAEAHREELKRYADALAAWNAQDHPDPKAKPVRPVREHFAVIDVTVERLAEMFAGSPRGLVVVRDELDGWVGSFTRYKAAGGGSDVPNWLSMFDAGAIRYHRRTGEPRDVECDRSFVAVTGGTQPDVLRAALAAPGFITSGLAARLLFAMPPKAVPRWTDAELDQDTEGRFREVLEFLRRLPFDPRSGPAAVRLDAVALDRFKRLNDEFAAAAEGEDGGPMAAAWPKAVRVALRLALVWHCVTEAAAGRDPAKGCITDAAMAAGEELARWFAHEAGRVYAAMAEPEELREARRRADLVRRKGGRATPRTLQRANARKYPSAAAAEAALDELVSMGWGVWESTPSEPGRPPREFVLRPTPDAGRQGGGEDGSPDLSWPDIGF